MIRHFTRKTLNAALHKVFLAVGWLRLIVTLTALVDSVSVSANKIIWKCQQ